MLPFGLCLAQKLFNAVAIGLEWSMHQRRVIHIYHHLDNFIVLGQPHTDWCVQDLQELLATCAELGVPLAEHKTSSHNLPHNFKDQDRYWPHSLSNNQTAVVCCLGAAASRQLYLSWSLKLWGRLWACFVFGVIRRAVPTENWSHWSGSWVTHAKWCSQASLSWAK